MVKLNDLARPAGVGKKSKRKGRGPGSGKGKTAGRGHKGHKARSGGSTRPGFEGGQMPLQRRLPKRGFSNKRFRLENEIVNLADLERIEADTISPEVLAEHRLVSLKRGPVKLLGNGEITRAVTVRVHAVSAAAREKIEAAGGTVELLE